MTSQMLARRGWLIVLITAAAIAGAGVATSREPPSYQQAVRYVLTPSAQVGDAQIPDTLRGSSGPDSQLTYTVAQALQTDRFTKPAVASLPPGQRGGYKVSASVVAGTDVIEVRLSGPSRAGLQTITGALTPHATHWVSGVYKAYRLQFLETKQLGASATSAIQRLLLAGIVGALLGMLVVYLEARLRGRGSRTGRPDAAPARDGGPAHGAAGVSGEHEWPPQRTRA
jgi:hypothetical protein